MKYLLIKDIKELVIQMTGPVAVITFFLICTLFLWVFPDTSYLSYGYASSELFFELAYYLLLFIIPILTIGGLSHEFNSGNIEIIKSLPVNWIHVLLSKFLSSCIFLLIIIVMSVLVMLVLSEITVNDAFDFYQTIGSFIGMLMIGAAFVALSILVSTFFSNSAISFIVSILIGFMFYSGFGFFASIEVLPEVIRRSVESWGLLYHAEYLSKGVLPLSSLIYMLSLIIVFLSLAHLKLVKKSI